MTRLLATAVALTALTASLTAGTASPGRDTRLAYRFKPLLKASALVDAAAPPGASGKLFLVQQDGRIRLVVKKKLRRKPFLNIQRLVFWGGERGLLSIAFHPAYARNRRFYVDYIAADGNTRVVEYRANRAGTQALPKTARRLLTVTQPGNEHKGGQLAFGPDGKLYVSLGDGQCCDDPANRAQDPAQLLGKLVRLDVSRTSPVPELVGLGLRNPWRFSFDRATGDLYIGDVGAGLWEEVDYRPRAGLDELVNYGWDAFEGFAVKEDKPPSPQGRLVFPVHAYSHDDGNCSIIGGFVYRGSRIPEAVGRYFYGDYCTGAVWSLRVEGGAAVDVRREPFTIPELSSFGEDARGELYAVSQAGRAYQLVP